MNKSLALLEFGSTAVGILAIDRMLKRSPVALLRCGTVHPGRYLALVGGSVAAAEEAHAEGGRVGAENAALIDEVLLPDPHPLLSAALGGARCAPAGDAAGVIEVSTSPGLLRALDRALKAVPVSLVEVRLADDLGGRALAIVDGLLPDVKEALDVAVGGAGSCAQVLGASLMPRLDETLRGVLAAGTRFATCVPCEPVGAETVEG
ncbi:MAG: BMC domain-containing protein [Candidatus Krumholzibacteriia bacterium]